jgi:succinate--hydroxymethylglutarate CoA-transferase
MIGAGNNKQFAILCNKVLGMPTLPADPRFATNEARVTHRAELVRIIEGVLMQRDREHWLAQLTGLGCVLRPLYIYTAELNYDYRVPFGPINNIQQTFAHPQVRTNLKYTWCC